MNGVLPREIFDHQIHDGLNWIRVFATDEPGAGGANHQYLIEVFDHDSESPDEPSGVPAYSVELNFQHGALKEVGANGVLESALIAVLLDRMRAFNSGPFSCRENALTATHLELALNYQGMRSRVRKFQQVEGTSENHK